MDKRAKERIKNFFDYYMEQIQQCCNAFPTCEGCRRIRSIQAVILEGKARKIGGKINDNN